MAFIIKSNTRLADPSASVGNIHGYTGPQDYVAMLDFSLQRYIVGGAEVAFGDVVNVTRESPAATYDVFGREGFVGPNEPAFAYMDNPRAAGLVLARTLANGCAGDTNGSAFTASNSGSSLYVAWSGSGSVTPITDGLTLQREVESLGRTHRFYSRSGAKSGTISVAGEVREVVVGNSDSVHGFVPHGTTRAQETFDLVGPALSPISSGDFTILFRVALMPDNGGSSLVRNVDIAAINSGAGFPGAVRVRSPYRRDLQTNHIVQIHQDGSAVNAGVTLGTILALRTEIPVVGMIAQGRGATSGVIAGGQVAFGSASAAGVTPPSALDKFVFGALPAGIITGNFQPGVVMTHAVIYDRAVTEAEALRMSSWGSA